VLDLGGRRMRWIDTPHVPHGWEAGVFFEEAEGVLFCGDLLTHGGDPAPLTELDVISPAIAMEEESKSMTMAPGTVAILRELAALSPQALALMHGSSYRGDGAGQLRALADWCEGKVPAA
jgi:hypothetical protein